ncbi:c-type cytochrome [Roseibium sp.]|uniref:c-type cytochrome n=1 Tax=Roseibium sp. TaxID=1936156 RepID=UPI003D10E532
MSIFRKTVVLVLTMGPGLAGAVAEAADDPIVTRQAIMASANAAAALGGGMMKGEVAYSPVAGKSVIATLRAASLSYGSFFPEGSDQGNTWAKPAIWEDPDGFAAKLTAFQAATAKANAASGKEGPADLEAFKAAVGPVFGICKSCHETYRKN